MRAIEYRPLASIDFESAVAYVAFVLASPQAAERISTTIAEAVERIADLPESGQTLSDGRLEAEYRRMLAGHHWIYYTFDDETITVHRIFHEKQDIDACALESIPNVETDEGSVGSS